MNDVKYKTRLELIRDNIVIGIVDSETGEKSNDIRFSSKTSVDAFPIASFESSDPELNNIFVDYSRHDFMRLSVCNRKDEEYLLMFEGEFHSKKIKTEGAKMNLTVHSIHSFFNLSLLELRSPEEFKDMTFKEFISKILYLANIRSKVHIETGLGDLPVHGLSRNTNLFRLFKEICLIADASVTFNKDNSVCLDTRSEKIKSIRSKTPILITDKDIISFEISE